MPDDDFGCPELWDEYEWERFLQQQDRKTDQYFALFEKYSDHPDRDEIIALEMGWNHVMDESDDDAAEDWGTVSEFSAEDEGDGDEEGSDELDLDDEEEDEEDEELDELQNSELYLQSMELNRRVFALVEGRDALKNNPVAVEMASRVAICGAKLAAALCGDDYSEVGMTIAYLKRSLKAATDSLNAAYRLHEAGSMSQSDLESLTVLLFPIREKIVDMMGEYRVELRRRRGEL